MQQGLPCRFPLCSVHWTPVDHTRQASYAVNTGLRENAGMTSTVTNYDGSIIARPQQLVYAESVEQIQSVLRNTRDFPSPVRAVGSNHSVTPCASSDGTMINMLRMN